MGGGNRTSSRANYAKISSQNQSLANTASSASGTRKKVFISFHMEDEAMVNLLRHQAGSEKFEDINFKTTTPTEPFDSHWRAHMREVISRSDVFVVAIGEDTHSREAVRWEIQTAYQMGKKVIGLRLHKDEDHDIPEQLSINNAPIVYWNLEEIQNAIDD